MHAIVHACVRTRQLMDDMRMHARTYACLCMSPEVGHFKAAGGGGDPWLNILAEPPVLTNLVGLCVSGRMQSKTNNPVYTQQWGKHQFTVCRAVG